MKLKVVRRSLPAVLTATILMSLLPPARTVFGADQAQQDSVPARVRRGKNGTKALDNQDSAAAQDGPPAASSSPQTTPAAFSAPVSGRTKVGESSENRSLYAQPSITDTSQDSSQSQQEREAPPFDRPPLGSQRSPKRSSPDRAGGSSQTNPKRPAYSDADSGSRSDSRDTYGNRPQSSTPAESNRSSYPDSSTGGQTDRSGRSGGQPPVLHRQSDSRPGGEDGTAPIDAGRQSGGTQRGTGQQQPGGEDEVVKLESTLVSIPLLVSDRSGRYVPQLRATDFLLYEDGVQQNIASLGNEEVPFNVALMLDVSPSVAGSVRDIQDAAVAFVRQLRNQDRVMVVSFDRQIHYLSDFTNDRRELERAIHSAQLGSGTSVYDAVYETVERKLRNIEGRKALILLSDGEDTTSSRVSYDDAVNLVSESDVLVYGLRYPGTGGRGGIRVDPWPRSPIPNIPLPFPWPFPRRRRGPFHLSGSVPAGNSAAQSWPRRRGGGGDFMKDLAAAGGGTVYDAQRISDMSSVANKIAEELRHVYVVSYYPSNALSNGGYRKVRVSVKSRDDIAVRHRPGYNARPNGSARPTI
jgi:Ca-activated chloride channel family protein